MAALTNGRSMFAISSIVWFFCFKGSSRLKNDVTGMLAEK